MGDSRGEVISRQLGLSDMMEYRVGVGLNQHGATQGVYYLTLDNVIVFTAEEGYRTVTTASIKISYGASLTKIINTLAAYGYNIDELLTSPFGSLRWCTLS